MLKESQRKIQKGKDWKSASIQGGDVSLKGKKKGRNICRKQRARKEKIKKEEKKGGKYLFIERYMERNQILVN